MENKIIYFNTKTEEGLNRLLDKLVRRGYSMPFSLRTANVYDIYGSDSLFIVNKETKTYRLSHLSFLMDMDVQVKVYR